MQHTVRVGPWLLDPYTGWEEAASERGAQTVPAMFDQTGCNQIYCCAGGRGTRCSSGSACRVRTDQAVQHVHAEALLTTGRLHAAISTPMLWHRWARAAMQAFTWALVVPNNPQQGSLHSKRLKGLV